jgi:NADH-quinone oxidoreductase subunit L
MLENFWLVLLFPAIGALINGFFGKRLPHRIIGLIACAAVFLSFLASFSVFLGMGHESEGNSETTVFLFRWIESGTFISDFALLVDPLSVLMMLVVTGVGFLIHVYSVEYMAGEDGYYRYFSYLNLFILMMSILVLANNYLLMFVGWEGVGLCSYLLIGYYFEKKSAGDAAKKAFIVNRIGDFGFALGIFLIFKTFDSLEYTTVFAAVSDWAPGTGVLVLITMLLFVGAIGKSAQIPLYVWLPDAMEGPTPVSALIHAATMVTAGVYMIARSAAFYSRAPETLAVVAGVGLLTALVAALVALAQTDIKKVLAYSTVSQLGYMFLAVGVGAFGTGVFHLMTHAFFKALLFLGSGSVILAMHHQQDILKMGGLKKYLPKTYWTMFVATGAIAGVPLLSGFFSKDEILWQAYSSPWGSLAFWIVGAVVAGLTAFYMFRMLFLTFHGEERIEFAHHAGEEHHDANDKPKESSWVVTLPLGILAVFSVAAGYVGLPPWTGLPNRFEHFLKPSFRFAYSEPIQHHGVAEEISLMLITIGIAATGILVAYHFYIRRTELPGLVARRFSFLHRLLRGKFFIDELYDAVLIHPIRRFSTSVLWRGIDVSVVDGAVNGTARVVKGWSGIIRLLQSGFVRSYAAWILVGSVLVVVYCLFAII